MTTDYITKTCTKCGESFPATTEYFYVDKRQSTYKLRAMCKVCIEENERKYRQANQDKISKRKRTYYQVNRDRIRKVRTKYYQVNRDKIHKQKREYRQANKGKIKEYNRKYQKENLERGRIIVSRRRARKRKLADTFTPEQWLACLEYHHYCCAVCGKQLRDLLGEIEPHADHWIPLSNAECPGTVASNMVCLCNDCNWSKNDTLPEIWLKKKYGTRKANEILKRINNYLIAAGC